MGFVFGRKMYLQVTNNTEYSSGLKVMKKIFFTKLKEEGNILRTEEILGGG
jgi:hypothetical protein